MPDAVFHLEGDRAVPTELARGPWLPDAQHGGAPAALLARAVEHSDDWDASVGFVARLTIELLRPVPLAPLDTVSRTIRPGKKVQLLEASLLADGIEVARATALRLRTLEPRLPASPSPLPTLPPPDTGSGVPLVAGEAFGFWNAFDLRKVRGSWGEPGPATIWFRLAVPIVAGEVPSPLQRVVAAADFGNGTSAALDSSRYTFINPDLTVALHRLPIGEWVALDAVTFTEPDGIGVAESALYDEGGRIGRALQTLLIDEVGR